jgi:hypothetical protein
MSAGPCEPPKSVVRDAPAEPVERPRQVGLAAKCLWASIGIGALPYFAVLAEMFVRSKLTASLSVIQLLLQAAAMVLVFTKPGSAWFRRQA